MRELSSEEEFYLRELIAIDHRDESVADFIESRRGDPCEAVYRSLVSKGAVFGGKQPIPFSGARKNVLPGSRFVYGELTSDGRCYFKDKVARADDEDKKRRAQWRHDARIAAFGIFGGLFSGAMGGWLVDVLSQAIAASLRSL